ncbi:MAG TPA: flagellar protein FlgN [Gammaproteobacteria bacterium]|nr:flagellar protein FlgN [Gammaproteobacteria bacterium]
MDKELASYTLDELLDKQLTDTKSLINLLEQEKDILTRDPEAVERLAAEKQLVISRLEDLHNESNSLLQQTGYAGDRDGMQAFLAWCGGNDGHLHKRWGELLDNVKNCRRLSQVNGMIVEKSTQSLRQALAILCGQTLTDVSYDASGTTVSEASGRPLAKA